MVLARRTLLAVSLALATGTATHGASAVERPTWTRPRVGGIVLFSASYGLALAAPLGSGFSNGREWLAVPAFGPMLGIALRADVPPWALVLDEVGQVGGLLLTLAGDHVSWSSTARLSSCPGMGARSVCASGRF